MSSFFQRAKKAVVAGVGAALVAGADALVDSLAGRGVNITETLGLALAAGISLGWATYRATNRPA